MPAIASKYNKIPIAPYSPPYILPVEDLSHGELEMFQTDRLSSERDLLEFGRF
jgi:hypothetical protein